MVMAEISITPIGTNNTSVSFYVARAVESIRDVPNIEYLLNSMGTVIESDNIDSVLTASKRMIETLHNLGVDRVGVILKIDSRVDKHATISQKVESVHRHLEGGTNDKD